MSRSEVMREECDASGLGAGARGNNTFTFTGRETLRFVFREREENLSARDLPVQTRI